MGRVLLIVLVALLFPAIARAGAAANGLAAWIDDSGSAALRAGTKALGQIGPGFAGPGGAEASAESGFPKELSADDCLYAATLTGTQPGQSTRYLLDAKKTAGGLQLNYEFRPAPADLCLQFQMPADAFAGSMVTLPDKQLTFPAAAPDQDTVLYSGRGRSVAFTLPEGDLRLTISQESALTLRSSRERRGAAFTLTFGPLAADGAAAGSGFKGSLLVESRGLETVMFRPVRTRTDTSNWFAFDLPHDVPGPGDEGFRGAVDFSGTLDKPAGKHGFLQVRGEHFLFADGTPAKFWGVNLDSGAGFPEKEYAPTIARRMAQVGINLVRFAPDRDSPLGLLAPGPTSRRIDPALLDRLDYFVKCLKDQGIYVRLDLMHYRMFRPGDGVDCLMSQTNASGHVYCGGPALFFQPRATEIYREFAAELLRHTNPYTKLRYVDDPALATFGMVNETSIFSGGLTETGRRTLDGLFQDWLKTHPGKERDRFLSETEQRWYESTKAYLRQLGVKAPIACTNITYGTPNGQLQALVGDQIENNRYWDSPHRDWRWFWERPMLKERGGVYRSMARAAVAGKPFLVTEFNLNDNQYRSEAQLLTLAYASLQDWDGILWWDYHNSYTAGSGFDKFMGTTGGNGELFSIRDNPMMMAQFGLASLAFRRGYISPARTAIDVTYADVFSATARDRGQGRRGSSPDSPFEALPLMCRVRSRYDGASSPRADLLIQLGGAPGAGAGDPHRLVLETPAPGAAVDELRTWRAVRERMQQLDLPAISAPGDTTFRSDTGQLAWDTKEGVLTIDSSKLQAAVGFVGQKRLQLADFTIDFASDPAGAAQPTFAAISLCSLDGLPLKQSARILLTAIGRAEDTGEIREQGPEGDFAFIGGLAPTLVEPVRGRIVWQGRKLRAFPLTAAGERMTAITPDAEGDGQVLTIGGDGTTWYELVPDLGT